MLPPVGMLLDETVEEPVSRRDLGRSRAPYLYVVLEGHRPASGGARVHLGGATEVVIGRGPERGVRRRGASLRVEVPSPSLSQSHVRLRLEAGGFCVEDLRSRNGTFVAGQRITTAVLDDGALFEAGRTFFCVGVACAALPAGDLDSAQLAHRPVGVRTLLPDLHDELEALRRIAVSSVPVLLLGQSGTGKELAARAVHHDSGRAGPFVAVNTGALPATLLEATLFGHTKGAFSGASRDEPGLLRAADGGTVFLDEIGDMPLPCQASLLRFLQEGEVLPVGAHRAVTVDARVVAATHRPLPQLSEQGAFRADLLARLRGFVHSLRPLAERGVDRGLLIADVLHAVAPQRASSVTFAPRVARAFATHPFPLNVREVAQALRAALAMSVDGVLEPQHLPSEMQSATLDGERPSLEPPPARAGMDLSPEDAALRDRLTGALSASGGNVLAAAKTLGKAPAQVYRWMRRFGVDPALYRRR